MPITTTPVIVSAIVSANPAVPFHFDDPSTVGQPVNIKGLKAVLTLAKERQPFGFCLHCFFSSLGSGWHRQHSHPGVP
jgi:hypothetical protein